SSTIELHPPRIMPGATALPTASPHRLPPRRPPSSPLPLGTDPDACPRRAPGGGGRIRTFELRRGQIYSLLPLTARPPLRSFDKAPGRLSARRSGGGDLRFLKGLVNNM